VEQTWYTVFGCPTVAKKRFVGHRAINCKRAMIGGVSAEATTVFVDVFVVSCTNVVPNPSKTVVRLVEGLGVRNNRVEENDDK